MSKDKKQPVGSEEPFLNTAARAVGTTLGKLAAKTGLAHPEPKPKARPAKVVPRKKKAAARPVAKKKKAAPKKPTAR